MKKEYDFSKMKEIRRGINLSPEVIDYFKRMSSEMNIPYQRLP